MVFKDVFARSEFDFGDFTALVHWECPSPPPSCSRKMRRRGGGGSLEEDAECSPHSALYIGMGFHFGADQEEGRLGTMVHGLQAPEQCDEKGRISTASYRLVPGHPLWKRVVLQA